ncbi:hypothetical protein A2Z41_03330 [Microgenomates group bacterium RBG_19FT_COMBO_39_10]|nr:MAG: hypothetical protein A2Z41_03330 [Microgenomates group bacterium RBG_19FT_COMBO_39_10]
MFPAQTSLIPVQIALIRFLEAHGWQAIFANFPYWYLDSTPFRYLSGPILPIITISLHRVLPNLSLFTIFFGIIGIAFILGALGVYLLLLKELKVGRLGAVLAAVFYFLGPMVPFLFRFADGLYLITFSFLPFVLIFYFRLIKQFQKKTAIFLILTITGLILLDTAIIPTLLFSMAIVFVSQTRWKRVEEKIKQTLIVLITALLIATLWYTPGYWLTLLTAPSLAGKSLFSVAISLPRLLSVFLALFFAFFSARFFKKKDLFRDFCLFWLLIFSFLTLSRFIADPDFWLDWISYGTELQMGIAIFLSYLIIRVENKNRKTYMISFLTILFLITWLFLFKQETLNNLQGDIEKSVEYRIGKELSEIIKPNEKVFLSGTTVFWLNAFFDIHQIRGGVDQVAAHPTWDSAVWEIREGTNVELSEKWFKELGISYLVVHEQSSEEFYHDFGHPEKFKQGDFEKVYQEDGDIIYKFNR